jgi:hypothetical protein
MNIQDVGRLSLGQWAACVRGWNIAHGAATVAPPTEEAFEQAVLAARGGIH